MILIKVPWGQLLYELSPVFKNAIFTVSSGFDGSAIAVYSGFEKGCRNKAQKCTRKDRKVVWYTLDWFCILA